MTTSRRRRLRPKVALASGLFLMGVAAVPSALATVPSGFPVDLEIEKTADKATYTPGDTITYTLNVGNSGTTSIPVDRIAITDPLAGSLTPARSVTTLAPGKHLKYTGKHTVTVGECGSLTNTATVAILPPGAGQPELKDNNTANDSASVVVTVAGEQCAHPPVTPPPPVVPPVVITPAVTPPALPAGTVAPAVKPPPAVGVGTGQVCLRPKLGAAISGKAYVRAGNVVQYRVTIRNNAATNASKKTTAGVTLPAGFSLVNRPKGVTINGRRLTVALGTLAAGGQRTLLVSLRADTTISGPRLVTVTASAMCGQTATDTTRTLVGSVLARRQPAVTG